MNAPATDSSSSTLLKRLFGLEKHEYGVVGWSFLYFTCVLSSYYVLRPIRDEMAVYSGSETIPYLFLGTFLVTLVTTPTFGWVTSRYPRRTFLPGVYFFFVCNILLFWGLFSLALANDESYLTLARVFFVWVSVFNLFVVSVFWSFMADIYTREQGRRLFGLISAGGSIGSVIGGVATSALVTNIGFQNLFPVAAVILFFAIVCIRKLRERVQIDQQPTAQIRKGKPLGGSAFAGITHMTSSAYFLGIGVSSVIASLLGTALYMFTADLLGQTGLDPNERTQFFSNINIAASVIAAIGQLFLVRHVVRMFGIGMALALMPLISIVGFAIVAVNPTLLGLAVLTAARRGLGFGVMKPSTDMLYSVVTPEEKYKTKNFIDTAIYRAGDLVGTWSVKGVMAAFSAGFAAILWLMVPFAIIWSAITLWLGRDYRRRAKLGIGTEQP